MPIIYIYNKQTNKNITSVNFFIALIMRNYLKREFIKFSKKPL